MLTNVALRMGFALENVIHQGPSWFGNLTTQLGTTAIRAMSVCAK